MYLNERVGDVRKVKRIVMSKVAVLIYDESFLKIRVHRFSLKIYSRQKLLRNRVLLW